jgi:hypothetical protein
MEPIANVFPAVVDAETYWRVNRKLSTKAPRGRHAPQQAKSIVSGIAFCATCGHAVTRVSKANMRAGGCTYLAVPYARVEEALRENAHRLIFEAPRGKSTAALEKQIDALQANTDAAEDMVFDLADLAARERSPTASRRLAEMERQLRAYQRGLRDLRATRDTLTAASVKGRLKAVERVLSTDTDTTETNRALRDAIRRIVVDPENGKLWVRWHHSDETQGISCVTRHMIWEDMREIKEPLHALFPERAADANSNQQETGP